MTTLRVHTFYLFFYKFTDEITSDVFLANAVVPIGVRIINCPETYGQAIEMQGDKGCPQTPLKKINDVINT